MGAEVEQGAVLQTPAGGEIPSQESAVKIAGARPDRLEGAGGFEKARVAGW